MKNKNCLALIFFMSLFISGTISGNNMHAGHRSYVADTTFVNLLAVNTSTDYQAEVPNFFPPSPTSKILQRFSGHPVSPATGTIDITIPLHELTYNQLSLPLELKYHTSGVRVQDPVGAVGRSWSLFPGFKISRNMNGKPDEIFPVMEGYLPTEEETTFLAMPFWNTITYCPNVDVTEKMLSDVQYDIFQIHMPNISGTFILTYEDGLYTAESIPQNPLSITPLLKQDSPFNGDFKRLYGFEVKDCEGIRYLFGESAPIANYQPTNYIETSDPTASYLLHRGWMLREIVFPNNDKITFSYQEIRDGQELFNDNIIIRDAGNIALPNGLPDDCLYHVTAALGENKGDDVSAGYYSIETSFTKSLVPTSIIFPNGEVDLIYESDLLESIIVKDKQSSLLKTIHLTRNSKDLLTGLGINDDVYMFDYYDHGNVPRTSGFDWWGYYNHTERKDPNIPRFEIEIITSCSWGSPRMQEAGFQANRMPNENYMDNWSLKEITYPTGGRFTIDYEAHLFGDPEDSSIERMGGGLRLKSTSLFDPISGKTTMKEYFYEEAVCTLPYYPDERSLLSTSYLYTIAHDIRFDSEGKYGNNPQKIELRKRVVSVFSQQSYFYDNPFPVWYGKVTEITNNAQKTEYQYNFTRNEYSVNRTQKWIEYPFHQESYTSEIHNISNPSPWLISQTHFKKEGSEYIKMRETINNYEPIDAGEVAQGIALAYRHPYGGEPLCFFHHSSPSPGYPYYKYFGYPAHFYQVTLSISKKMLVKSKEITYFNTDSTVQYTTYAYDVDRPYNIIKKETTGSDNNTWVERYYYSNHALPHRSALTSTQQGIIAQMEADNYKTSLLEQTLEKSGQLLFGKLYGFKKIGDLHYKPETLYSYEKGGFSPRIQYLEYDENGNPLYITKDADTEKVVYLWSYNGQYPIAEIRNYAYSDICKKAGNGNETTGKNILETIAGKAEPTEADWTVINNLRTSLPAGTLTTYTYKPLVGMTSQTDPRGVTTYYDYDAFGRLKETYIIEDGQKKVLSANKYHYSNR